MFSISRQTHPATGIEHCVSCCFFNNDETCLVTAGANIIKVFRLFPEGNTKEVNAAGQPIPPKMKLECLASYTLWGNVMSLASVKSQSTGRDLLLISFREAKLSVVQYDPQTNNLVTLSMHYFEEDDMKGGWTTHPHIPWIRVDPEGRCAVMLLYGKKLAVIPFRKDINNEDGDPLEAKPLETKKMAPVQPIQRAPTLASYIIVLKDLDEKIDNILDMQFLYGYYEPTLLLLYEPVRTFPGRTAVRNDTCAMAGVSVNMSARVHPVIWAHSGLPFDCLQAVPIQKPLGGCLIMAVNSLIYLNQSVPPYGVSLNSIAAQTTNFPLRVQDGVCITLDGACVAPLSDNRLALSLKGGQLYVLTMLSDSVRSVRSFHLDRAAASVLTTSMCVIEEDFLFLGSRLGNSLLLRVTERENRMLFSVDKPMEATVDLTGNDAEREAYEPPIIDITADDQAIKKRRLEAAKDLQPTDVIDMTSVDDLQVYGSDIRTTTSLTSYVFEVCDSVLSLCPLAAWAAGEGQVGAGTQLVACAGAAKNGALVVLQRSLAALPLADFALPGCIDMWTVMGEPTDGASTQKEEGSHAFLILTQEDSSMILQTGQEINEVEHTGFASGSPTVFAGNLGNNKYMVQVTTSTVLLLKNGNVIQSMQLEWRAQCAYTADPYLCVLSTCGRPSVMALREIRSTSGAMTARLAPTRQAVPYQPAILKATIYRDVSGLFTTQYNEHVQVKGEFTSKMKKKKNIKAEGFKEGQVIELNDEDEMLYGGDQTPASMASIMLAEQCQNPDVPRRMSRWWKKYLNEVKPTYWLFVVRANGNMEIYSLPEMRLSFLVRDICAGHRVLCDSLETASVDELSNEDNTEEHADKGTRNMDSGAVGGNVGAGGNIGDGVNVGGGGNVGGGDNLCEMLVVGMGHRGGRVLLLLRTKTNYILYQAFKYSRGNLKLRFSRVNLTFPFGFAPYTPTSTDNYELNMLKENVRQIRYFGNIGGYNGIFLCGNTPYFLLLTSRGELRVHPLSTENPPVVAFAPFNNANCKQGFLYYDSKSELRICALAPHLSYDCPWPLRKVPLRATPHNVVYHVESKTYCLVLSTEHVTHTYYKFNGEDKERSTENKGDRFPYPSMDKFTVCLFSPISWEIIPNTKIEFEEWEHITCLKNVALSYEGTRSGLRGYIVIGTNYNYSEDITSRGRILIYDIIDVVPEPGQPLTKNKFKEIYAKEQKGPVTAIAQVLGYLITAIGQKIYLWQLKDADLIGVAFIDTQIYVHRLITVKNLILAADVYKSVSLLRYQQQYRTLSLVARDLRYAQVYEMEFMVDNTSLGFLVSEGEGNLALFMYLPQARESYGGQRLVRKCDYRVGQQVAAMCRLHATTTRDTHLTMYTTLDGGIGYVLPISERVYRRLLMLQNVMNNYLCHTAGLNPRAYRTYRFHRRSAGSVAARGILDGDLIALYTTLPEADQLDIAKKIGTKVDEIVTDIFEIDKQTAHF